MDIYDQIKAERKRQDEKWGGKVHDDDHDDNDWLDILYGEYLEVDAEITEIRGDPEKIKTEIIQLAAVCVAWLESIKRREN